MSVTGRDFTDGVTIDKRNARAALYSARFHAVRRGELCEECGRKIEPQETVYHVKRGAHRRLGYSRRLTILCGDCAGDKLRDGWARPCEYCGRGVVRARGLTGRHVFCCRRCAWSYYNERAKRRRAKAREGKVCPVCGATFTPARKDAVYCSNACRQRGYRARKATA